MYSRIGLATTYFFPHITNKKKKKTSTLICGGGGGAGDSPRSYILTPLRICSRYPALSVTTHSVLRECRPRADSYIAGFA